MWVRSGAGQVRIEDIKSGQLKLYSIKLEIQQKNCKSNKQMNIPIWIVIQLAIVNVNCAVNDYIWVNYAAQLPITKINGTSATAGIPCEVRIGTCSITYTLLPLGWSSTPDGKMIFPVSELTKTGLFSIKAILTDIFDDKIEADLVIFIQNGFLNVKSRAQFMASNGFDAKNSVSKPLQIPSLQSKPLNLQGFPSTDELQTLIKTGNIYTISSKLKQVSQKYAPCPDRIVYLNRINKALKQKIAENEQSLKKYAEEINKLLTKIANAEEAKRNAETKLQSDKVFSDLQKSIKTLNSTKSQLEKNLTRYEYLSSRYLLNLNSVSSGGDGKNNTQEEIEIGKMEDEIKALQKVIEEAMKKKENLGQQIKDRKEKLKPKMANDKDVKQQKQKEDELMRAYESKYREYSDLAVKAKVQLQAVNQQFNSLNSRYRVKTLEVVDMDKQLQGLKSELKDLQSPIAVQAEQEQVDINQILKLSADNMQNKINLLSATQCGS